MPKDKESPPKDNGEKDKKEELTPGEGQPGKVEGKDQALLDLPEKLQGKSVKDIAEMYLGLEKKFGEHSKEVEDARKYLKEREVLDQAVSRNPELYKMLEKEINTLRGREQTPEGGGEAGKKTDPQISELRRVEENRAIADFQQKFGIDKLPQEERQDLMKKVSTQFADLLDPGGNKPVSQVLAEAKLDQLPKLFENSYWLVKKDSLMDRGKLPDRDLASIGSLSASSGKSEPSEGLTERERTTALKLGVDPDKYLKQKQKRDKGL